VPAQLTDRERQTVALIVDGLGNDAIAAALGITNRTVQAHVSSAMQKTGTATRTQLAVYALRSGLVPLNPSGVESNE
jgi:DNA-binding NarL/FixJ family response regulator